MEEMLDDTLTTEEDVNVEEAADAEVEKLLFEITDGKLDRAALTGIGIETSVRILVVVHLPLFTLL